MKNETEIKAKPYVNKWLILFIVFWLGVLTGALAILLLKGSLGDTQSSLLTPPTTITQPVVTIPTAPIINPGITLPRPPGG